MKNLKIGIVCHHHKLLNVPLLTLILDPKELLILGDMACGCGLMIYQKDNGKIKAEIIKRKKKTK